MTRLLLRQGLAHYRNRWLLLWGKVSVHRHNAAMHAAMGFLGLCLKV
jgi:hypothetical protein